MAQAARTAGAKKAPAKKGNIRRAASAFADAETGGTRAALKARASSAKERAGKAAGNVGNPRAYVRAGREIQGSGALTKSNPRHLLVAEFLICLVVLGVGTIVPTPAGAPEEGVPHLMVKGSGLALLFFILAVGSTGDRGAKVGAGLGALITAGYLLTSQDAHNILAWITAFYSKPGSPGAGVPTDATAARSTELVTYTPAVPYPWVLPGQVSSAAGPPAEVSA